MRTVTQLLSKVHRRSPKPRAFLADETRRLRNRVAAYRRRVTHMPTRIEDTIREHEEIMEAILTRDPEAAHRAMRAHLTLLGENLLDLIAGLD